MTQAAAAVVRTQLVVDAPIGRAFNVFTDEDAVRTHSKLSAYVRR